MKATYTFLFSLMILLIPNFQAKSQIKEYFITCDPDDFAYIYQNYEQDIYIPITFTCEGVTWNDTKMRIRGDGSRQLPKKSLKVKFYEDPFTNGRDVLNFNAEYEDQSYIRAYLSSQIFKMSGQTSFGAEHARLYLNGEFLGLYNRTENMDELFLEANNLDPDGNLYKATVDGACLSIYDDIENFWEQKTGSGNKQDLIQLIEEINQVSVEDYPAFIAEKMNYDLAVNIIACNMVTSNQSTYYHNYYMYRDANNTGLWQMMPWDLDKTLSVYAWRNHTSSSAPWTHDNPFLEKAILNPIMLADIKARANQIFQEVARTDVFWPKIDSLVQVLTASVAQDTTDNIQSLDEWLAQVAVEKSYFATFPAQLNWYFDNVQSSYTCEPTPGVSQPDLTFKWTPSVDPNGLPINYRFLLTTGNEFEPDLTQVYEGIQDTFLIIQNIEEGEYFWKVISIGAGQQEVEAFDSKNPLKVKDMIYLPCLINENLVLTVENSPYLINCDIEVLPDVVLTINPGVEIIFTDSFSLRIFGGIHAAGAESSPVVFRPDNGLLYWDTIHMANATSLCAFSHVQIINGRLNGLHSHIVLDQVYQYNSKILHWTDGLFTTFGGSVNVTNSSFISNNSGEGLIFSTPQSAVVTNCYFYKTPDAVEFLHCAGGLVQNNIIINPADDGIDFDNVHNSVIEGNVIYSAFDCGITLDHCSDITIVNNLVVSSKHAINLKDDSYALIRNNTLHQNEISFWLYEKNAGAGGGHATIINTIVSDSSEDTFVVDEQSDFTINYSLCNTEILDGAGNLMTDPMFESPSDSVFFLQPESPCIDAGDPDSPYDPDGTQSDIGAFFFNQGSFNIIFNEINYKSAANFNTEDWVELYNPDTIPANISEWEFKDEQDDHTFKIPYGTVIQPGGYLVLCNNSAMFAQKHQDVEHFIGDFDFGLSSSGEQVRLYNHVGELIDQVSFDATTPWPPEPNGEGPTLELKNPWMDNSLPESWCASSDYGTPGKINSCIVFTIEIPTVEVIIYPNPSNDIINIKVDGRFNILITNIHGQLVMTGLVEGNYILDLSGLPMGVYFIMLTNSTQTLIERIVVI